VSLALIVFIGWIFGTCIHEFCHAAVAYVGGDKSVKDKGYLTLNPLKYTDPGLTLVGPIVMLILGGIPLPGAAVYINRKALRNKLWHSAVSAAGPFGTALMMFVYAIPFMLGMVAPDSQDTDALALALLVLLHVVALLLNSLPLPPLDGYGVIEPWLPRPVQSMMNRFGLYGIWIVFGLLWFVRPLNIALWRTADRIALFLGVPPEMHERAYMLFSEEKYYVAMLLVGIMVFSRRGKKKAPAEAPPPASPTTTEVSADETKPSM
jgi:Zn-dependent protease